MVDISTNIAFNPELPQPVALSCWKHHLGFICRSIDQIMLLSKPMDFARPILEGIGGTLLDIYTGALTPQQVGTEVLRCIVDRFPLSQKEFSDWIELNGRNFRSVELSDNSRWALKMGTYKDRYVHIHPGRYSINSVRVRSVNLRVAIVFRLMYGWEENIYSVSRLNDARSALFLSPLNSKISVDGIVRILDLLTVKNN